MWCINWSEIYCYTIAALSKLQIKQYENNNSEVMMHKKHENINKYLPLSRHFPSIMMKSHSKLEICSIQQKITLYPTYARRRDSTHTYLHTATHTHTDEKAAIIPSNTYHIEILQFNILADGLRSSAVSK